MQDVEKCAKELELNIRNRKNSEPVHAEDWIHVLKEYKTLPEDSLVAVLRLLRIMAVQGKKFQNSIILVLPELVQVIDTGTKSVPGSIAVQVIGNCIVQHNSNGDLVWNALFPNKFLIWMVQHEDKAKSYLVAVLYNLILHEKHRRKALRKCGELINILLHLTLVETKSTEWVLRVFMVLLKDPCGFKELQLVLDVKDAWHIVSSEQLILWHVLLICMNGTSNCTSTNVVKIDFGQGHQLPSSLSIETVDVLLSHMTILFEYQPSSNSEYDTMNAQLVQNAKSVFIEILSTIVCHGNPTVQNYLCDQKGSYLLHHAVQEATLIPAFGYKSILVSFIGNLFTASTHNTLLQDQLRTSGGLVFLLNSTNIQPSQPYLREWSIYALKAALHQNESNQTFVDNLKSQDIHSTLPHHLDVQLVDGKPHFLNKSS